MGRWGLIWLLFGIIAGIWAATDADKRGKPGCLVLILIFFLGPVGLIIWLLFRPEKQP